MRIQTLQWIGGLLAGLCCLMLGGWMILINFEAHQQFEKGAQSYMRLSATLVAANAISAERGPSNSAMASSPDNFAALTKALAEKRSATDNTILTLLSAFASELEATPRLQAELDELKAALVRGRAAVDVIANQPAADRRGGDIANAIGFMFAAADRAIALRNRLAQVVIQTTPQISTEIVVATAASDMREYEGRLGSYVVMLLTSGLAEDVRHSRDFRNTEIRLEMLRDTLKTDATAYFSDSRINTLLAEVEQQYFGEALPYVRDIAARHGASNSFGAGEFTAAYVPMMGASEQLRGAVTAAAQARLFDLRDASLRAVILASALTTFALLVLTAIAAMFRGRLFGPLLLLSEQVTTIADGDLTEPIAVPHTGREVEHMFASVGTLRTQLREKHKLEQMQQELTAQLKVLAQTDALTGLPNRRAITEQAREILLDADARGEPVAVIMLDIDHFKKINDGFGHDMGDMVLQCVARTLPGELGANDVFARYGGEEFVAIVRNADDVTVTQIAEQLRQTLERTVVSAEHNLKATGSFGVAVRPAGAEMSWEILVATADRHLYRAKRSGRNRVSGPGARASVMAAS